MGDTKVSARGVYYDLELSPYEYHTPYGDLFKFPSRKKLDMYTRDIKKETERLSKALNRNGLYNHLPDEIISLLYRACYRSLYWHIVEG